MQGDSYLENIVRIGTVTAIDAKKNRARVKFQDTGISSGWLYVLQHSGAGVLIAPDGEHEHSVPAVGNTSKENDHDHEGAALACWLPKINETVLCLYLPAYNADGFILGGIV